MQTEIYKEYDVSLDNSVYKIVIGRNIINSIGLFLKNITKDKRVILVIDKFFEKSILTNLTNDLSGNGFDVLVHLFDAGKQNKNINEAIKIYSKLEANNFARDSTLIAVGGGVIGDLAGFVASTYLRGMNLVHIPTTLTGMIDSSIGGKVALHFKRTVNAIGNYFHPLINIMDTQFIDTLPDRDYQAGIAEIIKCAIICKRELYDFLLGNYQDILNHHEEALLKIMYGAIEIKLFHVTDDVKEQNKRLKLNYGHTLGHAIETATGLFEENFRHGEGVALGMVGAAHLAQDYFSIGNQILDQHEEILDRYNLPKRVDSSKIGFERAKLINACLRMVYKDKKRKEGKLRFILPTKIGGSGIYNDISEEYIKRAYEYLIN